MSQNEADKLFRYMEVMQYFHEHEQEPMYATIAKLKAMGYSNSEIQYGFRYWINMHRH